MEGVGCAPANNTRNEMNANDSAATQCKLCQMEPMLFGNEGVFELHWWNGVQFGMGAVLKCLRTKECKVFYQILCFGKDQIFDMVE
jgi:hypothetical protein